jgi:hypothetical protein
MSPRQTFYLVIGDRSPLPRLGSDRDLLRDQLTQWKDSGYLDTLAAAYAESGEFDQAMKFVNDAVARLSPTSEDRTEIEEPAACFRRREPWRAR